ncbi:major facilitator superfamily domain-containing protein [Tricladium varicosporioides]|nr:major facilitator superfamily domain-containing protein [Hymenoscyphus varicosporioides]
MAPLDLTPHTSPFEWSRTRKGFTLWLLCIAATSTTYAAGSYSPSAKAMSKEWQVSEVKVLLGITTFCIGYATAPMVFAPLSEIKGRYPVFLGAGAVWVSAQICCATTGSYFGMLFWRFWAGVGSSVFSTVAGGVVSDLYQEDDRSIPMALFAGASTFGMGLGPLVSGLFARWRWAFWVQVIMGVVLVAIFTFFFKETRGSVLLSRKAEALNQYYQNCEQAGWLPRERVRWKIQSDENIQSIGKMLRTSACRPFLLLFTEPTIILFSLWLSFAWAILYLAFGSIPLLFTTSHHFTSQQSSAIFSSICVGSMISTLLSVFRVSLFKQPRQWVGPLRVPEASLYSTCAESLLLPVGLLWLGWSQYEQIPWVVPALAVGCVTMGITSIYLAAFGYLTNTYPQYASSAFAAQSFCRTILGGSFAPITTIIFKNLTFQGALSLLSGLSLLLATIPWLLILYGPRIRTRSKFAKTSCRT